VLFGGNEFASKHECVVSQYARIVLRISSWMRDILLSKELQMGQLRGTDVNGASNVSRMFDELWNTSRQSSGGDLLSLWTSADYRDRVIELVNTFESAFSLDNDSREFLSRARREAKSGHARYALLTLRIVMQEYLPEYVNDDRSVDHAEPAA
jgi:hypothetical protein